MWEESLYHCCCSDCALKKGTAQTITIRKSIDNSSCSESRKSDRLKRLVANGRERNRMHVLNSAMALLRDVLPTGNGSSLRRSTAMSKIAILRSAQNYIRLLTSMLAKFDSCEDTEIKDNTGSGWSLLSPCGEVSMRRQQNYGIGDVLRQPKVTCAYRYRGRPSPTALSYYTTSQQTSPINQHTVS